MEGVAYKINRKASIIYSKMKVLVIFVLIVAAEAAHLPSAFKTCKRSDANYQDCLDKAITAAVSYLANGDKDLGFPKLDPLFVKVIHIHSKGGAVSLEQTFTDVNVVGFSKIIFSGFDYKIDDKNCEFKFMGKVPRIDMIAPYRAKGKILVLSLSGHGQSKLSMVEVVAEFTAKCEVTNGFINVKEMKALFTPKKVEIIADNLVDGNPELSAEVQKVMNENWADVYREVQPDYQDTYAEIFKQLSNIIFNKVPLDEIFIK